MGKTIKLNIEFDEGVREIEMKKPKGRHVDKIWDLMVNVTKTRDEKDTNAAIDAGNALKKYIDDLACELSGLTKDQMQDLDTDERSKITDVISSRAGEALNFGKLSGRQAN